MIIEVQLNSNKTKTMIFNFTDNFQFATRLELNGTPLETVNQIKILGVHITNDLKWDTNTNELTRKWYSRMRLLHKMIEFGYDTSELLHIYILYIRSVCEQSAFLWHSSLTIENEDDIERVQKTALEIIYGKQYENYENALKMSNLYTLKDRRNY